MRILGIAGSIRRGSHNRRLLRAAGELLPPGAILPWDANANSNHGIWAIEAGPNGQMAFMGYFTRIGGSKQQMIAKYSASHLI